ncbi:hypothetical protein DFQ28_005882 [Apophysomyces sp. BC1034]|nr:hypothetical protein DFQ29_007543 [Apophysomyces sp. BC1021]KAG0193264.1 hypothetical protein DFQ28_005882 [Apophysomyces sp. BC1034]
MRHITGRALNLFISILSRDAVRPIRRRFLSSTTYSVTERCTGCGRRLFPAWQASRTATTLWQPLRWSSSTTQVDLNEQPIPAHVKRITVSRNITDLASNGRVDDALDSYLALFQDGAFPTKEALYQLTRSLYRSSHLKGLYAVHHTLLAYYRFHPPSERRLRAMIYMYTMMIDLLTRQQRNPTEAIQKLCKEMAGFGLRGNVVFYNVLIKSFIARRDEEGVRAMFDELQKHMQPTLQTYSMLMRASAQRQDLDHVLELLDDMDRRHTVPDRVIIGILVQTLCVLNQFDAASKFVIEIDEINSTLLGPKYRRQLLESIEWKKDQRNQRKVHWKKKKATKRKEKSMLLKEAKTNAEKAEEKEQKKSL